MPHKSLFLFIFLISLIQNNIVFAQVNQLKPEIGLIDTRVMHNEDVTYTIFNIRDTSRIPSGIYRNRVFVNQAKNQILRVQWTRRGKLELTDSSLSVLNTFNPLYHSSSHPNRNMIIHFNSKKIEGYNLKLSGDTVMINDSSQIPFFDSYSYDLLIRGLPLKNGYKAEIPAYTYEDGGIGFYKITGVENVVLIQNENNKLACFKVSVIYKNIPTWLWISEQSRDLIALRSEMSKDFIIEMQIKKD
ncbi:hypothetical protein BH11BAC2_BH11BAC2_20280 [soil metagenome]